MTIDKSLPIALAALDVAPRTKPSNYPQPFAQRMARRRKRQLGDRFGLKNFGVNLTTIDAGGVSSLRHAHTVQDEFIYVVEGELVLRTDEGETLLRSGMCAGFAAGTGNAHQLVNRGTSPATYLEIGDRTPGDEGTYPDDDLKAVMVDGAWRFQHKDGTPY
ncbi:MAG: cupin domain-containing protein [Pseudomonadota bacterium]